MTGVAFEIALGVVAAAVVLTLTWPAFVGIAALGPFVVAIAGVVGGLYLMWSGAALWGLGLVACSIAWGAYSAFILVMIAGRP